MRRLAVLLLLVASSLGAQEKLRVAVTLPYLGEVVRAVGGDMVDVDVLAKPGTDPHAIQTTPAMSRRVKTASLFVENGMTLEGWAARLVRASGKRRLFPGQAGHLFATTGITALELPTPAQLSSGAHVHAAGNPHVWLDPINLKVVARNVEKTLGKSLYQSTDQLATNLAAFEKKIDNATFGTELVGLMGGKRLENLHRTGKLKAFLKGKKYRGKTLASRMGGFMARAAKLKRRNYLSYHKTWSYFEAAFGIKIVGTLEAKPGIPPSPKHLSRLRAKAQEEGVMAVMIPPYYSKLASTALRNRSV